MPKFVFVSDSNRKRYLRIVTPMGNLLARFGVHPNILTVAGLILSLFAGLIYSTGSFFWAAWVVVMAGTCDVLDGLIAVKTGKGSQFGAFLDSTLDRFGEVFIFLGLAWHFSGGPVFLEGIAGGQKITPNPLAVVLIILAIAGSFMVSYTRARAEGLGISCKVGWMQREERVTLLIIGSLLASIPVIGYILMELTLLLLAVLSNFTALHRMVYVRNQLLKENQTP
jgi:CDP-diacylglycerol--glycerol-3-phosphate 3-phosphatidyltransferase